MGGLRKNDCVCVWGGGVEKGGTLNKKTMFQVSL